MPGAVLVLLLVQLSLVHAAITYNTTAPHNSLPPPTAVYSALERNALRAHFGCFLRLKAAEPLVHVLPGSGILFQILAPAPEHLGRYCARGGEDAGAVEADIDVVDMFGRKARRSVGGAAAIVELQGNRRLFAGEVEVLQRIPEEETWRVYYPSSMTMLDRTVAAADAALEEVVTEIVTVRKVWANRRWREDCREALAAELGYDPYTRDVITRDMRPELDIGIQSYTFPLPGEGVAG